MAELTTLARPYARAAFDIARQDGKLAEWATALLEAEAVTSDDKVALLLESPALTSSQKSDALIKVLGDSVDSKFQNFISTLANNKRLLLLGTIKEMFLALKAQQEKSIEVEVTTAVELPESIKTALVAALTKKLEREVSISTAVDTSLLGGALIRAGDTVIDGSVKGRLNKLAEAMNS